MWTASAESYSWKPIESAPLDKDVTLQVTDGRGKPYTLRNPSRLTAAGWVSSGKGTPLSVTPVRWRPYHGSPPPRRHPAAFHRPGEPKRGRAAMLCGTPAGR
jgi:hypothetical protein